MELIQTTLQDKTVYAVKFDDGSRAAEVEAASLSWSTRLNKAGEVSLDAKVNAHDVDYARIRTVTEPKLYGLVLEIDGTLVEGGQIVSRDNPDGKITGLIAKGFLEYLQGVHVHSQNFNPLATDPKDDTVTFSNMSLRGIAGAILMAVANNPNNTAGKLPPVACDFAGEAGTHSRTYKGVDFTTVADAIIDLIEAAEGSDMTFIPEWVDYTKQAVQWRLVGGEPLLMQVGAPKVIDATAPKSGVSKLGVDEDGSGILTRVYATGSGEGAATVVGVNTALVNKGYPLMEAVEEFDATTQAALNVELDQKLLDASSTMSTWSMTMAFSDLNEHKPGDFLNIVTAGYRSIGDGTRLVRVVGIDGGGKQTVSVHLQPMLTTWANFNPSKVQRRYHEPDPVKAEAEDDRKTKKAITKAAKTGGTSTGGTSDGASGVHYTTVKGFSEHEDDMGLWVKNWEEGGDDVWAVNFRNFSLAVGDGVYVVKSDYGGRPEFIILGKYHEDQPAGHNVIAARVEEGSNSEDYNVTVTILGMGDEGPAVQATNHTQTLLASGDRVSVAVDTLDGLVVLGKGLSSSGKMSFWTPARVSLGYPFPSGALGMANTSGTADPNAQVLIDLDDAIGAGAGAKMIDHYTGLNNVYPEPATGVFISTGTPGPDWTYISRATFLKEGKLFQWFMGVSSTIPYLFKWNRGTMKWEQVPGLPTQRNILGDGYWTTASVKGEVVNYPVVSIVTADPAPYQVNGAWNYRAYVELWQVKPDWSGWFKSQKMTYEVRYRGFGTPPSLTSTSTMSAELTFNAGHYYMRMQSSTVNYQLQYFYAQASDGMTVANLTRLGESASGLNDWWRWFYPSTQIYGTLTYRVRADGAMYFAMAQVLDPSSSQSQKNPYNKFALKYHTGEMYEGIWANDTTSGGQLMLGATAVDRGGNSFLIHAKMKSARGTNQAVSVIREYDLDTNVQREIIGDATPTGAASYSGSTNLSIPTKTMMGDIAVLAATSTASPWQASEQIFRIIA